MLPFMKKSNGSITEKIAITPENSFDDDMKETMSKISMGAKMDDMDLMMDGMMSFYYMMKIHEGMEAKRELKDDKEPEMKGIGSLLMETING